jgi:hypothetical protein
MMRLAGRALLLAALCLLISAATVHADCAWVLWIRTVQVDRILAAYPLIQDCDEELANQAAALMKKGYTVHAPLRTNGFAAEAGIDRRTYHCLPDTVDLRDPKEK